MTRHQWVALAEREEGNALDAAAECPRRAPDRHRFPDPGGAPFPDDIATTMTTGGFVRRFMGRTEWHYDYIAAGA